MALKGLDIFKLTPKKNCKECGSPTCMAFAMKVAQGGVALDACPYMSDEAKATLGEATAPPMKAITFGTGDAECKLGGETVLFRHEKTFVSKSLYATSVCSDCFDACMEEIRKVDYERIGERMHVEILNLVYGGDPAAYWMFQTLFGGSTSSKLFLHVREEQSLCYYANAQFIAPKGILMVNSGIENKDFETARDEILRQLDACRAGDITDAEIDAARKTLTTNWRAMLDDPLTLERYWLGQAAAGTLVTPEERIAQVAAVTRGDIVAAAQATALDTVYFMKGAAQ